MLILYSWLILSILFFPAQVSANCRGCCSHHGGVVCRNGVTLCQDGTSLSSKCLSKGCNKCGSIPRRSKSVSTRGTQSRPSTSRPATAPRSSTIDKCICEGKVIYTDSGCPCEQLNELAEESTPVVGEESASSKTKDQIKIGNGGRATGTT